MNRIGLALFTAPLVFGLVAETANAQSAELRKRIGALSRLLEGPQRDVDEFVKNNCRADEQQQIATDLKQALSKIDDVGDVGIELSSPSQGQINLVLNDGTPLAVAFTLTESKPLQFTAIKLKKVDTRDHPQVPEFHWDQLAQQLDSVTGDWFSGVIVVVRGGKPVFQRAYGMANREQDIENSVDTVFAIGSAPIDFTWVSILILKDRGKLELADPITKFFDNVPQDKQAMTLAHLMRGESGLPDFHDRPQDSNKDHTYIDRDEAVRRILEADLLFEPGSDSRHSHSAWGLLAAIVEIASGKTYQAFTRDELFEPLGMNDTGFFGDPIDRQRVAVGYGYQKSSQPNSPDNWGKTSWLVMGSGGQVSTIPDMIRWKIGVHQGKLLSPESRKNYLGPGDMLASDGDMFGFEFKHSRDPRAMFLLISNSIDSRQKRRQFDAMGRGLFNLIHRNQSKTKFSLGIAMGISQQEGTVVRQVIKDGAGELAGLKPGDVLLKANGKELGSNPMPILDPLLQTGNEITFEVQRGQKKMIVKVQPQTRE